MFPQSKIDEILAFYRTIDRWQEISNYRRLRAAAEGIDNLFYGDSITEVWPLQEFFPRHRILNRGIRGDNVYGLYYRLEEDVLACRPRRVIMAIGINGIEEPDNAERIIELAGRMVDCGLDLCIGSILPLRYPDAWNRFRFQKKICDDNAGIAAWALRNGVRFIDYHAAMRDESGQLAAGYAQPDGTHLTFAGYCRMAETVAPYLLGGE